MAIRFQRPRLTAATEPRSFILAVALLPCLAMGLLAEDRHGLQSALVLIAGSMLVAVIIAQTFARLSKREVIPGAAVVGLLFALTLPAQTPLALAGVAIAFGVIVGREVFGSAERSFVHPAVLAHVFLLLAWPRAIPDASNPDALGATSLLACGLGALWLVLRGALRWRIVASVPFGVALGVGLIGRAMAPEAGPLPTLFEHLATGSLAFGAIFLATDPDSSPVRPSAQWFHGALIGFLIVLYRLATPSHPDATMTAILVASVFAPLANRVADAGRVRWAGARHV